MHLFVSVCYHKKNGGTDISYLLDKDGLNIEKLRALSYKSILQKSLKKNLHHFEKELLLQETYSVIDWYDDTNQGFILDDLSIDYRIKSKQSVLMKYNRYYPNTLAEKVFNDLLGFRSLCDSYEEVLLLQSKECFRIANMSTGKANDDGYRGVHAYFQIDHYHYPIEIQYNTYYDRQLNNWLHAYLYKKGFDNSVGKTMRSEYEHGNIKTENEFREVLNHVLSDSKKY